MWLDQTTKFSSLSWKCFQTAVCEIHTRVRDHHLTAGRDGKCLPGPLVAISTMLSYLLDIQACLGNTDAAPIPVFFHDLEPRATLYVYTE